MASKTTNYGLNKHDPEDFYDVNARNENWDKIDTVLAGKAGIQIGGDEPTGPGMVIWFADRKPPTLVTQTIPPLRLSADAEGAEVRATVDGKTYGVTNAKVGGEPTIECNYVFNVEKE